MKKTINLLLTFLLLFGLTCHAEEAASVVERIEIVAEKTEFLPDEEYTFTVKAYPETATVVNVEWSVDNLFVAPVASTTGLMLAAFPGEATITAQLKDNPEIKAEIKVTVLGDNSEVFKPVKISMHTYDKLYINNAIGGVAKYPFGISFISSTGGIIPENLGGVGWSQYYTAEYTDNFGGKKGITREGGNIYIAEDAEPAEDLYVSVIVKSKADGTVVCTGESNKFDVVKKLDVTSVAVNGASAKKDADGKYRITAESADLFEIKTTADREVYYSCQINGQPIKRIYDGKISADLLSEGENEIIVYIFGDGRKGALGYTMGALAETLIITVNK